MKSIIFHKYITKELIAPHNKSNHNTIPK